jgi:epoxyqueuosine reductase QueG
MSRDAPGPALEQFLAGLSLDLHGYADVRGLFAGPWGQWPRAIILGLALPKEAMEDVAHGPTARYYAVYQQANTSLNRDVRALEQWLRDSGFGAEAYPATVTLDELNARLGDTLSAPVQHKTVATRAGLGWIGRSGLLVTRRYGPRVRLASVFTDASLPVAAPVDEGRCGSCVRCVEACPAGAIRGAQWRMGMAREELVDVEACRRTAERLLLERAGQRDAVCGVCIAVCPFAGLRREGFHGGTAIAP